MLAVCTYKDVWRHFVLFYHSNFCAVGKQKRIWHTLLAKAAFVGKTIHFPILTLSTLEIVRVKKVSCMHAHRVRETNKQASKQTNTHKYTHPKMSHQTKPWNVRTNTQTLQVNGEILLQIFINFGMKPKAGRKGVKEKVSRAPCKFSTSEKWKAKEFALTH